MRNNSADKGELISTHTATPIARMKTFILIAVPASIFLLIVIIYWNPSASNTTKSTLIFISLFLVATAFYNLLIKSFDDFKDLNIYQYGIEFINTRKGSSLFMKFSEITDIYPIYTEQNNSGLQLKKLNLFGSALLVRNTAGYEEYIYEKLEGFQNIYAVLREKKHPELQFAWISEFERSKWGHSLLNCVAWQLTRRLRGTQTRRSF